MYYAAMRMFTKYSKNIIFVDFFHHVLISWSYSDYYFRIEYCIASRIAGFLFFASLIGFRWVFMSFLICRRNEGDRLRKQSLESVNEFECEITTTINQEPSIAYHL